MSVEALTWAFARGDLSTGPKFLLVALANSADRYGVCFLGRATLAELCSCNMKTITQNMNRLEQAELIARWVRRRANGSRTSDWTVIAPQHGDRGGMGDAPLEEFPRYIAEAAKQGTGYLPSPERDRLPFRPTQVTFPGRPEPLGNRKSVGVRARARGLKVQGKVVDPKAWQRTLDALTEFNEQTGKSCGALTGTGQPSEAAKRIYGRLLAWPELTGEQVADIIRRTLSSRWWGAGPPSVGVVFGPKVFEDNVARDGAPQNGNGHNANPEWSDALQQLMNPASNGGASA